MAKITFLAETGCLFSGIIGLIDAFSIANLWHQSMCGETVPPLFETEVVTADGKPVPAHGGIPIHPHKSVNDVAETDMILIPPFLPHVEPLPRRLDELTDWITVRYRDRTRIGALCTGAFVLAETGLLNGKIATTNWHFARMFQRRYPQVRLKPERILTEDDGLICSAAASSFFNLGLHVIETFGSPELASVCSKALLVDPNRNSQAPYVISDFFRDHTDAAILRAQTWMEENYTARFTIDAVAGQIGISPRHFKRRFKKATGESPLTYLQRLRIEAAKKKLETTRENMNEITWQIGYEDSSSFRRLFKKYTGLSPREYREKFSRAGAVVN
ncbi:GlxA family transcriptional regulator [Desulfonema ishimotonii]|uniref:GlxA family transcriptional regulator n=1 Tax=Desulfonema ishimotonii TaxID=45657 RepID=A0A401G0S5_9BACT|nr:helix-turn-helix domain-containing protein [Desulfonema ishimotonii]GBC62783.1 GlxA family transcriptional regulator [Desulfonema ishimotonii]